MATPTDTPDEGPELPPAPTVTDAGDRAPETERINVAIPASLAHRLEGECKARMLGKPFMVARALEEFLDNLPPLL